MRLIYFLILILCLAMVSIAFSSVARSSSPVNFAATFLARLRNNRIAEASEMLGDNTCNCPPHGGWISCLRYESGHDPNVAFLLGANFTSSPLICTRVPTAAAQVLPWEQPEDHRVTFQLHFMPEEPYFLPLPLAFGQPLPASRFQNFCANPYVDCAHGLTLRIRKSLTPGLIPEPKVDQNRRALPASAQIYLYPRDCGAVLDAAAKPLSSVSIAKTLPRISSITMSMLVVRRGFLSPWTIKSFEFTNPLFDKPTGQVYDKPRL